MFPSRFAPILQEMEPLAALFREAGHPDFQRHGDASSLVQNSLAWIQSRGCRSTVVNTEVSNAAALSIYERNGFIPLDYNLSIMERQLSI